MEEEEEEEEEEEVGKDREINDVSFVKIYR